VSQRIRVMLIDRSTLLRRCLALAIGRKRRLEVVAEVASGEQAMAAAVAAQPQIIILDPDVPHGGPRLMAELHERVPDCALIVLMASVDGGSARRALEAGALACLGKDCEPETVVDTIYRAHEGEVVMAPVLARALIEEHPTEHDGATGAQSVTAREREVLNLVARGYTNHGIANELMITEHTVKSHLAKLAGKLGQGNRVQLATYAMQHGMTNPSLR